MMYQTFHTARALALGLCLLFAAGAGWALSYHYTGQVGDCPLQMVLEQEILTVSGSYWQTDVAQRQVVRGNIDTFGTLTLYAFDANNRVIGTFTGLVQPPIDGATPMIRTQYRGEWESADGRFSGPFDLDAVAEYRTITYAQGPYYLTGTYPVFFFGAERRALNEQLRNQVLAAQQRFVRQTPVTGVVPPTGYYQDYTILVAGADDTRVDLLVTEYAEVGGPAPVIVSTITRYQMGS